MGNWKRVHDCALCGQDRCVVKADNERMGYCFRYGVTFFVQKDGTIHQAKKGEGKKIEILQEVFPHGKQSID